MMRALILGLGVALGLGWIGTASAPAAPASGPALGNAAGSASIVHEVPCAMRRVCGRRGCVRQRVCW